MTVILAVGARFDDRVTNTVDKFCPGAKIIHIDVDPASISKTVMADIPIVGPVQSVLTRLIAQIEQMQEKDDDLPDQPPWSAGGSRLTSGASPTACCQGGVMERAT